MNSLSRLAEILARHVEVDGIHESAIKGVGLIRASAPTMPMPVVYEPTLCLVAQGRKQAVLGTTAYVYDAAKYLVASVDLPVMGSVIEASVTRPYLCLRLNLGIAELSELAIRHPAPEADNGAPPIGMHGRCAGRGPSSREHSARRLAEHPSGKRKAADWRGSPLVASGPARYSGRGRCNCCPTVRSQAAAAARQGVVA